MLLAKFKASERYAPETDEDKKAYKALKRAVLKRPQAKGFKMRDFPHAEAVVDDSCVVYACAALLELPLQVCRLVWHYTEATVTSAAHHE